MHAAVTTLLFPLGIPELLIILVIVLVVFGANKLPGIGDALGRSIKNFKRASKTEDADDELEDASAGKKALAQGASHKQLDKPAAGDDGEWEEVVVRRRKTSANSD